MSNNIRLWRSQPHFIWLDSRHCQERWGGNGLEALGYLWGTFDSGLETG